MNNRLQRLMMILGSLLAITLLSNFSLAAKKKPKEDCRIAVTSPDTSDHDQPLGPDEIPNEFPARKGPGIDEVGDEFPSCDDNNYDGSYGAGGPWSNEF